MSPTTTIHHRMGHVDREKCADGGKYFCNILLSALIWFILLSLLIGKRKSNFLLLSVANFQISDNLYVLSLSDVCLSVGGSVGSALPSSVSNIYDVRIILLLSNWDIASRRPFLVIVAKSIDSPPPLPHSFLTVNTFIVLYIAIVAGCECLVI